MTSIIDIWGLQPALDNKAPTGHQHRISEIEGLRASLEAVQGGGSQQPTFIGDIDGLQAALDAKLEADDLTGLQSAIDGKAAAGHEQAIDTVTGLQSALDGKAAADHNHAVVTTSADGFMSAADKVKLNGLSTSTGPVTVAIADVAGLQTALDAKAAINHTHALATTTAAGFLSPADKAKLDGIGNLAEPSLLTYTMSQSSVRMGFTATYANMTDGSLTTGGGTEGGASGQWIKADLGSLKIISRITLTGGSLGAWGAPGPYLRSARIECSTDDANWAILQPSLTAITDSAPTTYIFGTVATRYVRIYVANYIATCEFKIYG